MQKFSQIVKEALELKPMEVAEFAKHMGFSDKYIYDLLKNRNGSRWNEDSMAKASKILSIKLHYSIEMKEVTNFGNEVISRGA